MPREEANTSAVAMNGIGQVAGDVHSDDGWSAFLWDPTAGMRSFGTPAGAVVMGATDLNNLGQVTGYMNVTQGDLADEPPEHSHAFLWDAVTGIRDLGTLPGGLDSGAVDTNNKGQVVGTFDLPPDADGSCCWSHAVLWDPTSGIRDLGTLPGGRSSKAVAINEAGQVVGNSDYPAGEDHTFLWDPGTGMQDLGPGQAVDINDAGQVIGTHWDENVGGHSFVWDPVTGMRDLGTLPGWTGDIRAQDVNNAGQVAGYLYVQSDPNSDFLPNRAFVWDPVTGMRPSRG